MYMYLHVCVLSLLLLEGLLKKHASHMFSKVLCTFPRVWAKNRWIHQYIIKINVFPRLPSVHVKLADKGDNVTKPAILSEGASLPNEKQFHVYNEKNAGVSVNITVTLRAQYTDRCEIKRPCVCATIQQACAKISVWLWDATWHC